jgi:riboflavin kinase/FMN adenylyltransferase
MLIRRGIGPCPDADPGRAVAIGNFDGVHLGHQAVLAVLKQRGRESRIPTAVACFEPQP